MIKEKCYIKLMSNLKFKLFYLFFVLGVGFLVLPVRSAYALRKRERKSPSSGQQTAYVSRGVGVRVRLRPDRLGLQMNFSNFENLESGTYELVYETNGVTQGAGGTIILGDTSTKELLFATCSHGVCRFHENITNARLSITSRLKNGQTVLKPFRIRI